MNSQSLDSEIPTSFAPKLPGRWLWRWFDWLGIWRKLLGMSSHCTNHWSWEWIFLPHDGCFWRLGQAWIQCHDAKWSETHTFCLGWISEFFSLKRWTIFLRFGDAINWLKPACAWRISLYFFFSPKSLIQVVLFQINLSEMKPWGGVFHLINLLVISWCFFFGGRYHPHPPSLQDRDPRLCGWVEPFRCCCKSGWKAFETKIGAKSGLTFWKKMSTEFNQDTFGSFGLKTGSKICGQLVIWSVSMFFFIGGDNVIFRSR